jgi:hypothetical protein
MEESSLSFFPCESRQPLDKIPRKLPRIRRPAKIAKITFELIARCWHLSPIVLCRDEALSHFLNPVAVAGRPICHRSNLRDRITRICSRAARKISIRDLLISDREWEAGM